MYSNYPASARGWNIAQLKKWIAEIERFQSQLIERFHRALELSCASAMKLDEDIYISSIEIRHDGEIWMIGPDHPDLHAHDWDIERIQGWIARQEKIALCDRFHRALDASEHDFYMLEGRIAIAGLFLDGSGNCWAYRPCLENMPLEAQQLEELETWISRYEFNAKIDVLFKSFQEGAR